MLSQSIKPTQTTERIPSLDFLRGVAILGILFINIENFAYPDSWSPYKYGFNSSIDHSTRFWVYFITQGKFYTMFALLFGVGFYIFLERLEKKDLGLKAMDIYSRRLLWLFIIGIAHAYLIWDGDVLYHYAICGFLLFSFRSIKTKNIIWVVAILCSLQLVKTYEQTNRTKQLYEDYLVASKTPEDSRSSEEKKTIENWHRKTEVKTADTTLVEAKKTTYFIGLKETYEHAKVHAGLVYYQGLLFPSLIVMLIGIILYRSGIFSNYNVWKYYWPITLAVLAVGFIINYERYYHWTYAYFDPVVSIWKGWLFAFPKEILGIGYVLVLNGLYQKFFIQFKSKLITTVGKMALSNYIFQNTLMGFLFFGYGLAWYNQFSRFELLGLVGVIWVIQIVLSSAWMTKYNQGPLEALWKKLTYRSFKD